MSDPSRIVREPTSRARLATIAREQFGDMVKAVINVRPSMGNRSRNVEDETLRARIVALVNTLVAD